MDRSNIISLSKHAWLLPVFSLESSVVSAVDPCPVHELPSSYLTLTLSVLPV